MMVTLFVGLPLLAFAAVVQSSIVTNFHLYGGALDLVLILTLSWTLAGDWPGGMVWGFAGGLLLDLLSGGPLGLTSLALVSMAYFASLTEGRLWRSHVLLPLATVALGTFGFHLVSLLGFTLLGQPVSPVLSSVEGWGVSLTRITLPAAVLNTVLALPLYALLRWLHGVVNPAPMTR